MNKDQIETVADKAWELANEPDTDFEACVLLKDCAFTIKELQSRLESLEQEMQEQARIIGMGAERELALVAKVESLEKDAARIDWMEKTGRVNIDRVREGRIDGPIRWDVEYGHNDQEARSKKCLRAAVDTAMQANKGG